MAFTKQHNRPMPGKPGGVAIVIAPGKGKEAGEPPEEKKPGAQGPLKKAPPKAGAYDDGRDAFPGKPNGPAGMMSERMGGAERMGGKDHMGQEQDALSPEPEPEAHSEELQSIADELGLPVEDVKEVASRVVDLVAEKLGL